MDFKQKEQLRKMFRWCLIKTHEMDLNECLPTASIIGILLMAINDINEDINYANEETIHFPWEEKEHPAQEKNSNQEASI